MFAIQPLSVDYMHTHGMNATPERKHASSGQDKHRSVLARPVVGTGGRQPIPSGSRYWTSRHSVDCWVLADAQVVCTNAFRSSEGHTDESTLIDYESPGGTSQISYRQAHLEGPFQPRQADTAYYFTMSDFNSDDGKGDRRLEGCGLQNGKTGSEQDLGRLR